MTTADTTVGDVNEPDDTCAQTDPHDRDDVLAFHRNMTENGWGLRPWRRLALLTPLLLPAALLLRVGNTVDWQAHDAWLIVTTLDLGNWLQVATGSFYAWLPVSGYVATLCLIGLIPATSRVILGGRAIKKERGGRTSMVTSVLEASCFIAIALPPIIALYLCNLYWASDWLGFAVAVATLTVGLLLGVLDYHRRGKSPITVHQYVKQAHFPPLPQPPEPDLLTANDLVSITLNAPTPWVIKRTNDNYFYCDTEELIRAIINKDLRPSDTADGNWKRVPVMLGHELAMTLNDRAKSGGAPVGSVRVDGELRIFYATEHGNVPLDEQSGAKAAFDGVILFVMQLFALAIIGALASSTPWVPLQCLDTGGPAAISGYPLTATDRGVLVMANQHPRRTFIVEHASTADESKCAKP